MLLTLGGTSAHASTSSSQSNLGTATTIGLKIRVSGALLLGAAPTGSTFFLIWGDGSATRVQINLAVAGGAAYVVVGGPSNADPVAASTATGNISSGAQYDIRAVYGAAGRSVGLYTTGGTLVASGSDSAVTIQNSGAGNGYVRWGGITTTPPGAIDGVEILSQAPPANSDPPRATDTGILWAVLDGVVGQLVSGATALDDLDDASWGAGGTWEPPPVVHELSPANLAVTSGLAPATITQAHVLAPAALTVAAGLATTTVEKEGDDHTLAPADLGVAAGIEAATIAQDHALTPVALGVTASLASTTLAQNHVLAPNDVGVGAEITETSVYEGVLNWGFLGDSQTDSYQSPDAGPESSGMGPPHEHATPGGPGGVLNWLEILVHAARLNPGAWGSFSEPRRFDFEYNWSRSGAVMSEVVDDQLAGLAAQVAAGTVTHSAIFATGNDWLNPADGLLYAPDIYGGNGTVTASAVPLSTLTASIVAQFTAIMDAIDAALDTAESGGGMVVMTPQDYLKAPPAWDPFPDPTRRGYVTGVVEAIHAGVVAYAAGLNSAAGYTRFAVIRSDHYLLDVWATASGDFLTISGAQVDMSEGWEYGETYDPYLLTIAPTTSSVSHAGTLMGGEYARAFLAGANQIPGVNIPALQDWEIQEAAGIPQLFPAPVAIAASLDAASLAQNHVLAPANLGVASTLEASTVAQAHDLSPANVGVSSTVEGASLSQGQTLSPADLGVTSAIEGATVAQDHGISPASLGVATSLEASTLTQDHALAPAGLSVSAALEATAATQGHVLSPASVSVTASLQTTSVAQAGELAPADLSVSASLEAATLSQAHVLAPADLSVAAGLDASGIAQAGELSPADMGVTASIEATAIAQDHVLAPADLSVTAAVEGAELMLAGELTPVDLTIAALLEEVALSQVHVLIPADLGIGSALDGTGVVTDAYSLSPAGMGVGVALEEAGATQIHALSAADLAVAASLEGTGLGLPITPLQRTRMVSADNRAVSVSQNPRTRRVYP